MKMGTDSAFLNEVSFPESFGFTETLSPCGTRGTSQDHGTDGGPDRITTLYFVLDRGTIA
jgi:hypothetical protein